MKSPRRHGRSKTRKNTIIRALPGWIMDKAIEKAEPGITHFFLNVSSLLA